MTLEVKPLAEITHEAISVLCKHLGAANTIRFINQFTKGYGNYTEDRQEIYGKLSLEEIVAEIEEKRKQP